MALSMQVVGRLRSGLLLCQAVKLAPGADANPHDVDEEVDTPELKLASTPGAEVSLIPRPDAPRRACCATGRESRPRPNGYQQPGQDRSFGS